MYMKCLKECWHVIIVQKITIAIIIVFINNLPAAWHHEAKDTVGSPFPAFLPSSIHSHAHHPITPGLRQQMRDPRKACAGGPAVGPRPVRPALPTSDSLFVVFLLQNSPLWWLKVKRLWPPRLSTPDPQPQPLPPPSSVSAQFVYVIFYSPLSSFGPQMTPSFWKMLEKQ